MGISRLVILALLALAGWWLWKKTQALASTRTGRDEPETTAMVCCQHCQLHLPQPDAVQHQNRWYCCQAHAQAGPQRP
ncbi:MAG: PP0621 family protein [Thiopseudomonas sp.]